MELKPQEPTDSHLVFTPANLETKELPQDTELPLQHTNQDPEQLVDTNLEPELLELLEPLEPLEPQDPLPTNLQPMLASTEVEVELETFHLQEDTEPAD